MKSFRIDDANAISDERVLKAIKESSRGKRTRDDVVRVLSETEKYVKRIQRMVELGEFKPRKSKPCLVNERGQKKTRTIIKPTYYPEQVIHHIAVDSMKEPAMHGLDDFVLGSIPGRGAHVGKKYIKKWVTHDEKNTRIVSKLDIMHFFQSIDHDILRAWIHKKIRPGIIRDLLDIIIEAADEGIPLGYYTSQWFANFLLQPLDHFIREELHVCHYIRYIDDIVLFGGNKKKMHEITRAIDAFVWREFQLTIKPNWQVFRLQYEKAETCLSINKLHNLYRLDWMLWQNKIKHRLVMHNGRRRIILSIQTYEKSKEYIDALLSAYGGTASKTVTLHGRALDFLGFKFYKNRITLRKSIMLAATRKARQIKRRSRICWKEAAAMISYMGWISHTDTYGLFLDRIRPFVNNRRLRRVIANHARRERHANYLESCRGHAT